MDKLVELLRSITWREVVMLFALSPIIGLGSFLWWGYGHPDEWIDLLNGEQYIGNIDQCILLEFRQQKQKRYRIVYNLMAQGDTTIALSAGSPKLWPREEQITLCQKLRELKP